MYSHVYIDHRTMYSHVYIDHKTMYHHVYIDHKTMYSYVDWPQNNLESVCYKLIYICIKYDVLHR